jgi:erythromycin esterase-like protein
MMPKRNDALLTEATDAMALIAPVRELSRPLRNVHDLDPLLDRIGDATCVLLGEASHGTSEYYTWRAALSKRLIREKGFSFIAVEGDWPDCYRVNRYVKGYADAGDNAHEVLHAFERWPTWMWANEEVVALAEWVRRHNDSAVADQKVGFYGLDVYSLWDSLYAVMTYLRRTDPSALDAAWKAYHCFEPYGEDEQAYARATRFVPDACEKEVIDLLAELRAKAPQYRADDREAYFQAEQNALVVKNAEAYYRAMVRGGPDSWNVRDRHMAETLERLLQHHGPGAKAIVWEHNTHIGDARYTDMADDGMVNVGQLARDRFGAERAVLVGFGSHRGTVIAGKSWEAPMERMEVPPARPGSWEDVLHTAGPTNKLLLFGDTGPTEALVEPRGHRAIGVVYRPEYEQHGNYVPTVLPRRYDAFLYLDHTHALRPLHWQTHPKPEVPETFPSGM